MNFFITGTAGFIGNAVALSLLDSGHNVYGIDNFNDYYDIRLKIARHTRLTQHTNYLHSKIDICDPALRDLVLEYSPDVFIHLAAQAGVRYSIQSPDAYMHSNMQGFFNILEACKNTVDHLVYASSSSVYGNNQTPFHEDDDVTDPVSFYAATKVSNEIMAKSYENIYGLRSTGLRFFTVYGPWGRPDMAVYKFTEKILAGEEIELYNMGKNLRDFTYVDDIVSGVTAVSQSHNCKSIYNIGHNNPIEVLEFVAILEELIGVPAKKNLVPQALGDVTETYANIDRISEDFNFKPTITMREGLTSFLDWYYYYNKFCKESP